jgi:large subunit ribosomal protein L35
MPKMKTHRGAAKRLKSTGTGRLKRNKANKSHILTKKTTKRKRGLRKPALVSKPDEKRLKRLLPYGG